MPPRPPLYKPPPPVSGAHFDKHGQVFFPNARNIETPPPPTSFSEDLRDLRDPETIGEALAELRRYYEDPMHDLADQLLED